MTQFLSPSHTFNSSTDFLFLHLNISQINLFLPHLHFQHSKIYHLGYLILVPFILIILLPVPPNTRIYTVIFDYTFSALWFYDFVLLHFKILNVRLFLLNKRVIFKFSVNVVCIQSLS